MELTISLIIYLMIAIGLCKINLKNGESIAASLSFFPPLDLYSFYKASGLNFITFFLIPCIVSIIANFIGGIIGIILLIYVLINVIIILHSISIKNGGDIVSTILIILLPPIGFLYLGFKK